MAASSPWIAGQPGSLSGTGQINVVFPVTPQTGAHIPKAVTSSVDRYPSIATRL